MIATSVIKKQLQNTFKDATIEVTDSRGDGHHFQLSIESAELQDLMPVQQHRAVYNALGKELTDAIHAISIKIVPPPT